MTLEEGSEEYRAEVDWEIEAERRGAAGGKEGGMSQGRVHNFTGEFDRRTSGKGGIR